ncbi:MAG: AAA domain-containing protein [Planctomycetota bacterium]
MPTNDEQLTIIRRLHGRSGVLVQGPPGTGKSHTIVNLVSHLLACGQRVLVTSQTPRALKVLRDKIPEAILPLTVSLLGEDAESRQNLEHSVQGILRHVNSTNPTDAQRQIAAKTRERQSLQARLAELRRRLREIREAETTAYSIPGTPYQGTAQAIAQVLSRDSERFSWLPDQVGEETEPPLTDGQFKELYSLWQQCRDHSLGYTLPPLDTLPTADDFENAINTCSRTRDALMQFGENADGSFAQGLCEVGRARLAQLWEIAQRFIHLSDWLAKRTAPWIGRVRQEVFAGRALDWSSLESATSKALESLAEPAGKGSDLDLEAPAGISRAQLLADAAALLSHLKCGGGWGFWVFRPHVVKRCAYLWRDTRFAGRQCDSPPVLKSLVAHLRAPETLDRVWQEWSDIVEAPKGTMRHRLACLEQCRNMLKAILQLGNLVSDAEKALGETKGTIKAASGANWGQELLGNVQVALALLDVTDALAVLSGITDRVSQCRNLANPHPVVHDLAAVAEQGNVGGYREQLARLVELHHERSLAEQCLSLDKRLRESAPALADAIKSVEMRPALAAHLDSFGGAWAWKRATAWLERFSAEHSAGVADEITRTEGQLQEATQTLVALKAWNSCMEKLASNPTQQGALSAWQQMVKKIGKGTGKYAETYRRDARKYMQQCRNAIPAWIMPLYRVAEQVEAEPEIFDVVIVDEASQTGPEGLILQYLAKQCVIVGDDKQISPEGRFVEGSQVRVLMEQHLDGIPFSETLDPGTSLFDQAAVRYGNRITLREHFRCMPEIIRFSNELCYTDTPLIPLRQYPPSRLPPIQVRFVVDGYREGTAQQVVNRPEAAAVAKTVLDCLNDPRYKGKSFGVICLQGHAQAQLIENMILDKIGPQPFKDEKTRLLCGDPYSFQGDERDIVFLSMVASIEGDGRSGPLTHESFKQRFNVAASRPRDQAWLFHSIRESDLHPDCMRRRLLNFCYNPGANTRNSNGEDYESGF